jgi:hypothetical protein
MTLRELYDILQQTAQNHQSINQFGWGTVDGINQNSNIDYPLFWVEEPTSFNQNNGQITYSVAFYILDRNYSQNTSDYIDSSQPYTNPIDVISKCQQIGETFLMQLDKTYPEFLVEDGTLFNCVTLENTSFSDSVVGVRFEIEINAIGDWRNCELPFNQYNPILPLDASTFQQSCQNACQEFIQNEIDSAIPDGNQVGDALIWDGSSYVPQQIDALPDGNNVGDVLVWDGSQFVPQQISTKKTYSIDGTLQYIENNTFVVRLDQKYSAELKEITCKTKSGSFTLDVKINNTGIGGLTGLSIDSNKQTFTATSGNTLQTGDKITFEFSNVTIMEDFSFSIKEVEQ